MAKIKHPLLSAEASGMIGPRLTFSKRGSGQQVRIQRKQKDYVSAGRAQQRLWFSMAEGWWHELSPAEQEEWTPLG